MSSKVLLFVGALLAASAVAQQQCNVTTSCGTRAPCCSEYGFCGKDNYCLGGCNPLYSNGLDSCLPTPICKNAQFTFKDDKSIVNGTQYDGNSTAHAWTLDKGDYQITPQGELALLLTEKNGGTRISSTTYVHYGTMSARMKTSRWTGVVTAFITMSDIKDEIDYEWPGANTTHAQTNIFWLGNLDYTRGESFLVGGDTYSEYHTYTIDWQPDVLTFSIDGKVVRRTTKESTKNAAGLFEYPTTPSRVQFSIWPAGIPASPKGVIEWAGGLIDWNNADYKAAGHYYIFLQSVNITCSKAVQLPSDAVSYVYGANVSSVPSVAISNRSTLIGGAPARFAASSLTAIGVASLAALAAALL